MYLKRLGIKNFRVFDEDGVTLAFNQGVNAIMEKIIPVNLQ